MNKTKEFLEEWVNTEKKEEKGEQATNKTKEFVEEWVKNTTN